MNKLVVIFAFLRAGWDMYKRWLQRRSHYPVQDPRVSQQYLNQLRLQ